MRILVFGAGVLGCNLANDLFRAEYQNSHSKASCL